MAEHHEQDRDLERDQGPEGGKRLIAKLIKPNGGAVAAVADAHDDRAVEVGGDGDAAGATFAAGDAAPGSTGTGKPSLMFHNSYSQRMFIAYKVRDWGCFSNCGERWLTQGWMVLEPGQLDSRPNPTLNSFFYYYAETADGHSTHSTGHITEVRRRRFSKCTCLGVVGDTTDPFHPVGMEEVDTSVFSGVEVTVG